MLQMKHSCLCDFLYNNFMKTTLLFVEKIKRDNPGKMDCHSHDFWQMFFPFPVFLKSILVNVPECLEKRYVGKRSKCWINLIDFFDHNLLK